MTRSPRTMAPGRKSARQTSIADFFTTTPPRPHKRVNVDRSPARVDEPVTQPASFTPTPDHMKIEPPSDPAQELTQEELDVHDQLESLGCSQKRPRGTPPDDTDGTPPRGEPSDGEDSDDSVLDMERDVALRRSTRITREVIRYGPEVSRLRGTSVFGNSFSRSRSTGTDMKRALREFNQKAKQEERLEEIRKEVDEVGKAGQDETLFQEMADAEEKADQIRREALDKYSAPVPLFTRKVTMRTLSKQQKRKRSGTYAVHPVHDLIVQALKEGDDIADVALSFVVTVVKQHCQCNDIKGLARVADYLFLLSVFDPTDDKSGRISRDCLLEAIEEILRADVNAFKSAPRLQSVISVLECYGAVFEDKSDLRKVSSFEMSDGSLDQQVPMIHTGDGDDNNEDDENVDDMKELREKDSKDKGDKTKKDNKDEDDFPPVSDEFIRCERNLSRLFRIAAAQVRCGVPLGIVICNESLGVHESVLLSLGVCTRVLHSAFGNRLHYEVGELISASLSLIDEADWPEFRMKAAAYIHSFTTRLELHVELVTYLLPYTNGRIRGLGLDIGYLSLQQWCSANTPSTITTNPSARAREVGIRCVSFCVSDVVRHVQSIPALTPTTDMIWISLLARLLKVLMSEASVVERRMAGEFGVLKKFIMKMSVTTRRLGLEVPVQRMRIALDTVDKIMQEFAKGSERNELGLKDEEKPRQGNLMSMRATV